MKRLIATVQADIRLQFRNGFYYASLFVAAIWVVLLTRALPAPNVGFALPGLILGNLIVNTFYFVGGLVLLEKGEGTLEAQVVTPLRTWEYLAAKIITLTALSLVENIVLVGLVYGFGFHALWLALGIALAAAVFTLLGFVFVARYDSINEFLWPSALAVVALLLPLIAYVALWDNPILYLHPLQAPFLLLRAAFVPVEAWKVVYGVAYALLWVGVAYLWSQRTFYQFVIARQGVRQL